MQSLNVPPSLLMTPAAGALERCFLGEWRVDFSTHRARGPQGESATMTPKASAVLLHLASAQGRPVTREALLAAVWAGTCPTDDVLSQAVAELRRTFGDNARNPQYVETITKVGYRLVAPVRADEVALPPRQWPWQVLAPALLLLALLVTAGLASKRQTEARALTAGSLGAHISPLTADPGVELFPSISPDGARVVYSARSSEGRDFDLFVARPGTTDRERITEEPLSSDYMATWSPDGQRIAFLRVSEGECGIHIVGAEGGFPRRVGDCIVGVISFLDWSPDGRYLVYPLRSGTYGLVTRFYRLDLNTGQSEPIAYEGSATELDLLPRYSADGRWLAFRRGAVPFSNLYVMPAEGGEPRLLVELNSRIHGLDWLSDSSTVVFSANIDGRDAIATVELATGAVRVLDWRAAHLLSVDRNDTIVYSEYNVDPNVGEFDLDSSRYRDLFASTRAETAASYSPDGERVVMISDRGGSFQVWVGNRIDGSLVQISDLADGVPEHPRWSPDGQSVVYLVRRPGRTRLLVADIVRGTTRDLTPEADELGLATVSTDGLWLVYAARDGGRWRLWRRAMNGAGAPVKISDHPARTPNAAPDGFVYFAPPHGVGVWRVAVEGGVPELVTEKPRFRNVRAWTVAEDGIYYLSFSMRLQAMTLQRVPWGSERVDQVATFDHVHDAMNLSLRPDGKAVLLTRLEDSRADVFMASGWRAADS